jgi:hypothetical protein
VYRLILSPPPLSPHIAATFGHVLASSINSTGLQLSAAAIAWSVGSLTDPPLLSREMVLTDTPDSSANRLEVSTPAFNMATLNLPLLIRYIVLATPFIQALLAHPNAVADADHWKARYVG